MKKATAILVLVAMTALSGPAQVRQKKPAPPLRPVEQNWLVWGGPQRDFITASTGLFAQSGEKWMAKPPKKLWERALGDGYSAIAVEASPFVATRQWFNLDAH